jgi:hypothetical protein
VIQGREPGADNVAVIADPATLHLS